MNNGFSPSQTCKTGNVDANLILRHHKLDIMAQFFKKKSVNPKTKRNEIAKDLNYSSSTLQRYRHDKTMQSPYKSSNNKGPQETSNDLKISQKESSTDMDSTITRSTNKKNNLKGANPNDIPNHGSVFVYLMNKFFQKRKFFVC